MGPPLGGGPTPHSREREREHCLSTTLGVHVHQSIALHTHTFKIHAQVTAFGRIASCCFCSKQSKAFWTCLSRAQPAINALHVTTSLLLCMSSNSFAFPRSPHLHVHPREHCPAQYYSATSPTLQSCHDFVSPFVSYSARTTCLQNAGISDYFWKDPFTLHLLKVVKCLLNLNFLCIAYSQGIPRDNIPRRSTPPQIHHAIKKNTILGIHVHKSPTWLNISCRDPSLPSHCGIVFS